MPKAHFENLPKTIWLERDSADGIWGIYLIDQTRLPLQGDILCCRSLEGIKTCIQTLAVRGAPALGVAAAMALAIWAVNEYEDVTDASPACTSVRGETPQQPQSPQAAKSLRVAAFLKALEAVAADVATWRPTAVNLSWGAYKLLEKLQNLVASSSEGADGQPGAASHGDVAEDALCLESLKSALVSFAQQMANEDEATNRALGKLGAKHLKLGNSPLTICNTGSLACVYYGTALGVLYSAWEADKLEHVWVTETRPLNQGSRLSMWELACLGIPATLVTDSMAATLMAQGLVSCVIVGADRICANGDVANKVGTLGLAVLAHHYELPFYVVAPHATVDLSAASGAAVSIEQRDGREVAGFAASGLILPQTDEQIRALDLLTQSGPCELAIKQGHQMLVDRKGGAYAFDGWFATTVPNAAVYNPAFDITPAELITALVTEKGVFSAIMGTMDFWQESEQL